MSDVATADIGRSFVSLDDMPDISDDLLQRLVVNPGMRSLTFTATDETVGYVGANAGSNPNSAAVNLLMAHQPFAG